MLSVAEASRTILANIRQLDVEQVQLAECVGKVLARRLHSR